MASGRFQFLRMQIRVELKEALTNQNLLLLLLLFATIENDAWTLTLQTRNVEIQYSQKN